MMPAPRLLLCVWAVAALLDLAIAFSGHGTPATVARVATTYSCGLALSLVGYPFLARSRDAAHEFTVTRVLAVAVPSGAAVFLIDVFGRAIAQGHAPFAVWPTAYVLRLRQNWAYLTMLFVFQSAFIALVASARALELRDRQLLEARLTALRLQLNPHFLFNTLNAITVLVRESATAEAERMLLRLSDFLRLTLASEPAAQVTLAAEIDSLQAYLGIEEARFGHRLAVRYACDAGLEDVMVPNFILQPLLENAVKHAVAPSSGVVTISIGAHRDGADLVLRVSDDGRAPAHARNGAGTGVGLRNVAARLDALYGPAGSLETSRSSDGYTATVRFPVAKREARRTPTAA